MSSLVNDVIEALKIMDYEELSEVQCELEKILETKIDSKTVGCHFDNIKDQFIRRFGTAEVEKIRSWRQLTLREKELFTKAWLRAKSVLRRLGVEDSHEQTMFIYLAVKNCPDIKKPTLAKMIYHTKTIQLLINSQFPNYSNEQLRMAIKLMVKNGQ